MSRSSHGRLAHASRLLLLTGLLCWTAASNAHGGAKHEDTQVRAVLDALPPALEPLHVQLRHTLAPQLLVANPSDIPLFVEDAQGRRFLRIGPGDVNADLGAAAFHRSNTLMAPGTIPASASQAPNWQQVEQTPSWGWFDLRLRTDAVTVPHRVVDAGTAAEVGRWSIPVHYGDTNSAIRGHFEFVPPARGIIEARVTNAGAVADQAVVRALTGSARPGLFVSYRGRQPLVVMGAGNAPFLRFSQDGVQVNRASATWAEVRPRGAPAAVRASRDATTSWARVSRSASYGWIEPRAAYAGTPARADTPQTVSKWRIPIELGGRRSAIRGVTEWQPVTPLSRNSH